MKRKDAIEYLEDDDRLDSPYLERKFTKKEEAEIQKVMKQGRIYGDPIVILNG